jgi:hypothetical protein
VSGLVFVFVGPYLTLLALHHTHREPELLAAGPGSVSGSGSGGDSPPAGPPG